jgi:hypothetical protein
MGFGLHGSQFTKTGDLMIASFFISVSLSPVFRHFGITF